MKNTFKYLLMMLMCITLSVSLSACGDDDDEPNPTQSLSKQLVGSWVETNVDPDEPPYYLNLRSNNTGDISYSVSRATVTLSQNFKWEAGTTADGDGYVNILTTSGDDILDDGKYRCVVIGNELYLGGLRFKKK